MRRLTVMSFLLILSLCLMFGTWVSVSIGRPFRVDKLPDKGKNWGCATCHVNPAGGGARNTFGKDYEAIGIPAGDKYTAKLGQKDSDGDGFTNDEEFNAKPPTEPWNRNSHPPEKPRAVNSQGKQFIIWGKLKKR